MAICGHYSPPMSHTHTPECSFWSSRAADVGFSTTPLPLLHVVSHCGCCYWCLFSRSTPSNTPHWPTSMPAVMQGVVYLSARWVRYTHTHSDTHIHMSNMDPQMEDPLIAVSPRGVYPFHSGSIPCSYSTSLLFSSFNLSLSLCTSISAGVWAQLWIRSLWVNP